MYDDTSEQTTLWAEIPLTEIKDYYNLMLTQSRLMLVRHGSEYLFHVVWTEKAEFYVGNTESFYSRDAEKLYFSHWFEDPDYRDEVVIQHFPSDEILNIIAGKMLDGQRWILQ